MRQQWFLILLAALAFVSCEHKELSIGSSCEPEDNPIKVVVHWEDTGAEPRSMRINLFSQTLGVGDYGRDEVPATGVKYIYLEEGASYLPFCYDYNASNIYFRDELELETFEAYFAGLSRATYNNYTSVAPDEATCSAPTNGEFFLHAWTSPFEVAPNTQGERVIDFYPKNILRPFTYRVNHVVGIDNIKDVLGAVSGMAASYFFHTNRPSAIRSTLLFGEVKKGHDPSTGYGYLEGVFYSFAPPAPYRNWFTIELYSTGNAYRNASWNVTDQVEESMRDRAAKLARDGYDILIENNPEEGIPDIDPGESTSGGGFDIGVDEWGDEEIVILK